MKKRTIIAGSASVAVALAATGTGLALAFGSAAQASPANSSNVLASGVSANGAAMQGAIGAFGPIRRELRQDLRQLVRHTVHADFLVKTQHGYITVSFDRGKVLSFSAGEISITRPDGTEVSAKITSSTKFFGLNESQIGSGDRAIVVQTGGNAVDVLSANPRSAPSSATTA